ncbi:MAG TPA: hypothetical protein VH540_22140 [Ktedonobacterales bacterium]|jgi:hypothetical protein
MEEALTPTEEIWQAVVCRLCAHRFEVLITCPEDAQITLCQFCTILVEWFGLPEEVPLTAQPLLVAPASVPGSIPPGTAGLQVEATLEETPHGETPGLSPKAGTQQAGLFPDPPAPEPEPVVKVPKKTRQRAQLAGLLDQWGDLWRSSQEE